ncbi:uncharacterized protein LOC125859217 [Solanum stenotomum]|uniref:uncharacterized protein LOC125859217 n=1 Tax=Solanum stenotomum TaxID=172797 RepID=UPI0020D078B0|nr:uncharacterized protein LOC125859217 [Solanum stenotomum]
MPTIPMPTIVSPNQGGTPIIDASAQINTPTISETLPVTQNQSNPIAQDLSTQSIPTCHGNPTAEGDISTQNNPIGHRNTIVEDTNITFDLHMLEPSITCSSFITKSFRSEVDPNGINWRSVSNDVKDGYFGEFKSETNSKNRRRGREVAAGTHTGGSISIGEYRKRLAIKKGRDPTPVELHLHVHTHDHDEKSFVDERSRIVHETYEEILQEKMASQSDIDQSEAYNQAMGGEKKRRIYGLGSEVKNYYKHKLCASSFVRPSVSQSASTTNMDEFVKEMLPALTNRFLPVIIERVQEMITPVDNPSPLTPTMPPPATTSEVDPLVSSDDDAIP